MYSYSLINNMKSLTEDSNSTDITIAHGLKILGVIIIVGGHRIIIDLAAPAFNPNFSDHVWILNLKYFWV